MAVKANHQNAKYPVAYPVLASGILRAAFSAQWGRCAAGPLGRGWCPGSTNETPSPSSRAEDGRPPREGDQREYGAQTARGTETQRSVSHGLTVDTACNNLSFVSTFLYFLNFAGSLS